MYKCASCGKTSQPGESQNKIIISSRKKVYRNKNKYTEETFETEGFEIVKEQNFCNKCSKERIK